MSRIGRMPIAIPAGVTVDIAENNKVTVKGPKGTLDLRPLMIFSFLSAPYFNAMRIVLKLPSLTKSYFLIYPLVLEKQAGKFALAIRFASKGIKGLFCKFHQMKRTRKGYCIEIVYGREFGFTLLFYLHCCFSHEFTSFYLANGMLNNLNNSRASSES